MERPELNEILSAMLASRGASIDDMSLLQVTHYIKHFDTIHGQ